MDRNHLDLIAIAAGAVGVLAGSVRAQWRGVRGPTTWVLIVAIVLMIFALVLSRYTQTYPLLVGTAVVSLGVAAVLYGRAWRRSGS